MKYLIERASAITPKDSLDDLLNSKKSLRIKLGVDPTAPDVTLGSVSYTHLTLPTT